MKVSEAARRLAQTGDQATADAVGRLARAKNIDSVAEALLLPLSDLRQAAQLRSSQEAIVLRARLAACVSSEVLCAPPAAAVQAQTSTHNWLGSVREWARDSPLWQALRFGSVVELAGESGSGKTQLALQLAVDVQRAVAGAEAAFVCTEAPFPSTRLRQLVLEAQRRDAAVGAAPIDYEKHVHVRNEVAAPRERTLGLFADKPVDLGSRCTVFMNSSVKQAQKDGASIENISAGLSISVVKNALYKVIRASSPEELGRNIVVQGGTFYNEAVLRAFEKEMGVNVIRPDIAGLMGAYGAALYGKARTAAGQMSTVLTQDELEHFEQKVSTVQCGGCGNHCQLTINVFADGKRYISGNRCDKPVTGKATSDDLDLYAYKLKLLLDYKPENEGNSRGVIGIPLCLNMYELLPFWHTFFTKLGFTVKVSPVSSRKLYQEGQATIPSDTACFPAKLSHGHIAELCKMGVDAVFYPCMSYNVDEHLGDNHYNCPVVAYYPEVLVGNCPELENTKFIYDYINLARRKDFTKRFPAILDQYFPGIPVKEVHAAIDAAYDEYEHHMTQVRAKGAEIIARARAEHRHIIVLAGRPYHVDPEVNHGIDKLIIRQGAAVVTEDSVSCYEEKFDTAVLNQWTYHSRLYAAAKYCTTQPDMDLVQLVSFGCGLDAITTDETREILQEGGKLYTQLKIDEITNLGAVNIRLRSLFAALEERKEDQ